MSNIFVNIFEYSLFQTRVDKVHVDGLCRTKNDVIQSQVKELFKAQDFEDVIINTYTVLNKLKSLGCFKNIEVYIDTSHGPDSTPEGVEVINHCFSLSMLAIIYS